MLKTNVLLIWCKHPEPNWLFKIEDMNLEQLAALQAANELPHGEESEDLHKIAAAVGDKKRTEECPGWDSIWVGNRVTDIIAKPVDRIYACGFTMKEETNV